MNPSKSKSHDEAARDIARHSASQLNRSERGTVVLRNLRRMIEQGANGLDDENWQAVIKLCELGRRAGTFAIIDVLDELRIE